MMLRAATSDGRDVKINVHPAFQLFMAICTAVITGWLAWGTKTLVDVDARVRVIEANRFTVEDANEIRSQYVTVREYDARALAISAQLRRIEDKIDAMGAR